MGCFSCFVSQEKKSRRKADNHEDRQFPVVQPHQKDQSIPQQLSQQQSKPQPQLNSENHKTKPFAQRESNHKDGGGGTSNNTKDSAQTFTFRELAIATKNFRQECLIGEGGFGRVYKGNLEKNSQIVAIKQLDRNGLQGNKEFLVEVLMLSLLHHKNLVNLVGYCADGDQRLLVYEYMSHGSLEDHLLDLPKGQKPLDWVTRMRIALGAAKGLEYLHHKANPPVIYRDLKSSNILLDDDFNAKLSDFGLAKVGPTGDNTHVSSRVMGTYGYCAPEYQRTGKLTVKSDVYSFGVVLLELITGRRVIDTTLPINGQNLILWAEPIFREQGRYSELADPLMGGEYPVRGLNQAVAVAIMCLQEEAVARPLMSDVVSAVTYLGSSTASFKKSLETHPPLLMENEGCQDNKGGPTLQRSQTLAEVLRGA